MKKKRMIGWIGIVLLLCVLAWTPNAVTAEETQEQAWPKVGEIYRYSGVDWTVRGVGKKPFEYTATGESLSLVVEGTPSAIVLVPKKGQVVRCDSTVPMIYVDAVPDPDLSRNDYFKRTAKDKVFLLLELKRN